VPATRSLPLCLWLPGAVIDARLLAREIAGASAADDRPAGAFGSPLHRRRVVPGRP